MLDGGVENNGVVCYGLFRLGFGILFEEVGVNFGGVVTFVEQSPADRTHHVHVQLAVPLLNTVEIVLILLPNQLSPRNTWQERNYN